MQLFMYPLHRGVPRAYLFLFILWRRCTHCASSFGDLPWLFYHRRVIYSECTPRREVIYLNECISSIHCQMVLTAAVLRTAYTTIERTCVLAKSCTYGLNTPPKSASLPRNPRLVLACVHNDPYHEIGSRLIRY